MAPGREAKVFGHAKMLCLFSNKQLLDLWKKEKKMDDEGEKGGLQCVATAA